MGFYKLEEALKVTSDPLVALIIKTYMVKNPLSNVLTFEDADDIIYKWFVKNGVGGAGRREINGAFHEGTGTQVDIKTVQLGIYNEVRKIDRIIAQYKGDLLKSGIVATELEDILTSIVYKSMYDFINGDSANTGEKFDGMVKLATRAGMNYTINEAGIASALTKDNIYDEMAKLQDETLGEDTQKVFLVDRKAFTKVNKLLKESGLETTIATDNFGRPYTHFRNSLILPMGSYVLDPQDGVKAKIDLMPTATFEGTDNTHRIICANFGPSNVHALRGNKGTMINMSNVENLQPATHPTIDVEDTMAIVDKAQNSIAVLEGVIL